MSFLVRILFSGLMAFVPSEDGTELTVLLLSVDHGYHTSDGAALPHHNPLLIARGNCAGDCPRRDADIAKILYIDRPVTQAQDSLATAVGNGGAWILYDSELAIRKGATSDPALPALVLRRNDRGIVNGQPQVIPTTSNERRDYSWIANLKQVCGSGCALDPAVLAAQPPGIVVARLRLKTGSVFTYSVARIGSDVTPVQFKRLDGTGSVSPYSQAVATWVGADIEVAGESIQIAEAKFDGSAGRTMTLAPDASGKVEIAVLNLPPFVPPASPNNNAPQVGKHFETYYDLLENPPAKEARLVVLGGGAPSTPPYPQVAWSAVHPQDALWSELLNQLRLNAGRTAYDRTLCPPTEIPLP